MDSPKRTLAKTITWQISGFVMMAILGFVVTGSFMAAGGLALTSMVIGTVSYVLHERVWARVHWGRTVSQ